MSQESVSDFILTLKAMFDVASDEALASELGVGKSTIATWRRRGSVPKKTSDAIRRQFDVDWKQISNLKTRQDRVIDKLQRTSFFLAIMQLARHVKSEQLLELSEWLAVDQHHVYIVLSEHFKNDEIARAKPEEFASLLARVARGEHASPEQLLARRTEFLEDRRKCEDEGSSLGSSPNGSGDHD